MYEDGDWTMCEVGVPKGVVGCSVGEAAEVGTAVLVLEEADEGRLCLAGGNQKSPNVVCGWFVFLRAVLPLYICQKARRQLNHSEMLTSTGRSQEGRKEEQRTDEDELECVCPVDWDAIRFERDETDAVDEWDGVVLGT